MKTQALILPEPERCVFCDRYADEWHHVAGRARCGWFVVALCTFHHWLTHKAITNAGAEIMLSTSDVEESRRRARKACLVFMWLLDETDAGVSMSETSDMRQRIERARRACLVFLCLLKEIVYREGMNHESDRT